MKLHDLEGDFASAIRDTVRSALHDPQPVRIHLPKDYFAEAQSARWATGTDALRAGYPALARLVGDDNFRFLAREFHVRTPPLSPSLGHMGCAFPRFLRDFERVHGLASLSDIAELELMLTRAYHAEESNPLTVDDLAKVSPECVDKLTLEWHPSADLFMSPFPAVSIWRAVAIDGDSMDHEMATAGESALVIRRDDCVCIVSLSYGTDLFLALMMRGHSLGEAAEGALFADPDFDLGRSLVILLASGAVTGWQLAGGRPVKPLMSPYREQRSRPHS